jgi:hypothetical protein
MDLSLYRRIICGPFAVRILIAIRFSSRTPKRGSRLGGFRFSSHWKQISPVIVTGPEMRPKKMLGRLVCNKIYQHAILLLTRSVKACQRAAFHVIGTVNPLSGIQGLAKRLLVDGFPIENVSVRRQTPLTLAHSIQATKHFGERCGLVTGKRCKFLELLQTASPWEIMIFQPLGWFPKVKYYSLASCLGPGGQLHASRGLFEAVVPSGFSACNHGVTHRSVAKCSPICMDIGFG